MAYSNYEWLVILQRNDTGEQFNITRNVHQIEHFSEWMTGQPSRAELLIVITPDIEEDMAFLTKAHPGWDVKHGHIIQFSINGEGIFKGFITNVGLDATHIIRVIARDQIFYLKSKDIQYTENMTASEIFTHICSIKENIVHEVRTPSVYINPEKLYRGDTLFSMIKHAIDVTIVEENKHYLIRDEFGTLVFTDLSQLMTDVTLGDHEYAIGYQFESSIEEDTYNYVKIMRDNEEIGMRDFWVTQDPDTIERWGKLQLLINADKNMTDQDIMQIGQMHLAYHNKPTETLSIVSMGRLGVYAGNGINLNIGKVELSGSFWVAYAKHTFRNCFHSMDLEMYYSPMSLTQFAYGTGVQSGGGME